MAYQYDWARVLASHVQECRFIPPYCKNKITTYRNVYHKGNQRLETGRYKMYIQTFIYKYKHV